MTRRGTTNLMNLTDLMISASIVAMRLDFESIQVQVFK
jgi:hypothetical protein